MSLLLEALKKAEKAKEEAQRRARGESAAPPADAAQPEATPRVVTRDELPKISQPLEIVDDDIAPPEPPRAAPAKAPPAPQNEERAAARKVFEAKFREPNPRLPFYLTLGVLGAFALGTVGYFWYQLRPPPALVNATPRAAPEQPVAAAQPTPVFAAIPVAQAQPSIPGLPAAPAPQVAPPPRPQPAPMERPLLQERPLLPQASTMLTVNRANPEVHPKVNAAYAAYLAGDVAAARAAYEAALADDPLNRDALLGLAALDVRAGRLEAAEAGYVRLLQLDPRDAYAQAGLIALRTGRIDAVSAESRVKTLLAADPGAHVLHFTLGNQLAQQGRWAEAQQEYFKAFATDPDNADFAYNLAVSLDQLRRPALALEYYQRALALAEKRAASFSSAAARERIAQLTR